MGKLVMGASNKMANRSPTLVARCGPGPLSALAFKGRDGRRLAVVLLRD